MDRRSFMKTAGAAAGALALGPQIASARTSEERFIVKGNSTTLAAIDADEVVHDLIDEIGYAVIRADESDVPNFLDYAPDLEVEWELPVEADVTVDAIDNEPPAGTGPSPYYPLQWDKQEQHLQDVHATYGTGSGARVAIIDSGIMLGHDDLLPVADGGNLRTDLSRDYTFEGDPWPDLLDSDHGTHVAGTVAAQGNSFTIGHAPDAELVNLRVFNPEGFGGDVIGALVYAATPVADGGAGCDVANLSLGFPPLVPVEGAGSTIDPDGAGPIIPLEPEFVEFYFDLYSAAGEYAVFNDCLPVASAGNDDLHIDRPHDVRQHGTDGDGPGGDDPQGDGPVATRRDAVIIPAECAGFMSVSACGPVGYLWGAGDTGSAALELPTTEPAFYTNFGPNGVDVSAAGGNVDIDAIGADLSTPLPETDFPDPWYLDLVFSTVWAIADTDGDGTYEMVPTAGWKLGTSMSAPQVSGLAALIKANNSSLSALDVRAIIENSAQHVPVAQSPAGDDIGETTAPSNRGENVSLDGVYDGEVASNPDSATVDFGSQHYRGSGHIDSLSALSSATATDASDAGSDIELDGSYSGASPDGNRGDGQRGDGY